MKLRVDLVLRQMGDEYVIVDPSQDVVDMSKVFTLNETAAFIWKELYGNDFDIDRVAQLLFDKYDVAYDQALSDSNLLINKFAKEGLLEK